MITHAQRTHIVAKKLALSTPEIVILDPVILDGRNAVRVDIICHSQQESGAPADSLLQAVFQTSSDRQSWADFHIETNVGVGFSSFAVGPLNAMALRCVLELATGGSPATATVAIGMTATTL